MSNSSSIIDSMIYQDFWPEFEQSGIAFPSLDKSASASDQGTMRQQIESFLAVATPILSLPSPPKHTLQVAPGKIFLELTFPRLTNKGYDVRATIDNLGITIWAGQLVSIPMRDISDQTEMLKQAFGLMRELLSPTCRLREKSVAGQVVWASVDAWNGSGWDGLFESEADGVVESGPVSRKSFINHAMPPRPGSLAPSNASPQKKSGSQSNSRYFDGSMLSHYLLVLLGILLLCLSAWLYFGIESKSGNNRAVYITLGTGGAALFAGVKSIITYTRHRREAKTDWQ